MPNFNIEQLQAYIKAKRQEYITLTQPGYDIYFYSRFNNEAAIVPFIQGSISFTQKEIKTMDGITPNAILSSNISRNTDVTCVLNIAVRNSIINPTGSTCDLEIINPEGIDYFLPTIGTYGKNASNTGIKTTNSKTDYDFSEGQPISNQRIGNMDTVIIKLKNKKPSTILNTKSDMDTVFRGCILGIHRSSTPTGGNRLILRLGDFSEFLRMITAIPLGFFSTISFSITGRGLVDNLVKYSNRLYSGDWRFVFSDQVKEFANTVQSGITTATSAQAYSASSPTNAASNSTNHAMAVPPFFYLQYSDLLSDTKIKTASNLTSQIAPSLGRKTY